MLLPGGDAAVIRVKRPDNRFPQGTSEKGIAMSIDCNSRYCAIDPYQGARMAVAEAARNVSCVGAEPVGLTDCLNFGNPENPEIMWQFKRGVEGISDACRELDIPVVSGNVSFYNETNGLSVYPTPNIGMVGLLSDITKVTSHFFKGVAHKIVLLGESLDSSHDESMGGSEYLSWFYQQAGVRLPKFDFELEKRVQRLVRELVDNRMIFSAHDCSEGGLAVALLESAFTKGIGAHINYPKNIRAESLLFGESPSRVVVTVDRSHLLSLEQYCQAHRVPYAILGETLSHRFIFNDFLDLDLYELKNIWESSFEKFIQR